MAPIPYYMQFIVWFKQQADYDFALGLSSGQPNLRIAPDTVAGLFGLQPFPNYPSGDVSQIPVSISFGSVFGPGQELRFPGPTGVFLNAVDVEYHVLCQPGIPASIWPCPGDDSHDAVFYWEAIWNFNAGAGAGSQPPPNPTDIPQRRWADGGEFGAFMEGGSGITSTSRSKIASRVPGGRGFLFRGSMTTSTFTHLVAQFRTGLATHRSHERVYFRGIRTGTGNVTLWRCHSSLQSTGGSFLRWEPGGNVVIIDVTGLAVERPQGTLFTPTLNEWYCIDIYLKFGDGTAGSGRARFVVNKGVVADIAYSPSDNSGMSLNGNHTESDLGPSSGSSLDTEWDMDDWICTDLPDNIDPDTLADDPTLDPPIDFLIGSHVRAHRTDPTTASFVNWAGNAGILNQGSTPQTASTSTLVSTTALARIQGLTDLTDLATLDTQFVTIGIAAATVGLYSANAANTDGQLGYRLAGGGDTLVTVDQTFAAAARPMMYFPTGMEVPDEAAPLDVVHLKSNDANSDTTTAMSFAAEHLGAWGPEDADGFEAFGPRDYLHNSPYFNNPWGWYGGGSESPVYAYGFTYAGNSGYQQFALPAAAHFIKLRNITTLSEGLNWFSSGGPVIGSVDRVVPNLDVWTDQITGDCFMAVSGANTLTNLTGQTYQVIVFCDPGMRFMLNGGFAHSLNSTAPFANPLLFDNFLPEFAFCAEQQPESLSNNQGMSAKGPGNTGNAGTGLGGSALANWGTFTTGFLNSLGDLHQSLPQLMSCWRSTEPGCAGTMVQIFSYIGNGAGGTRVINCTPVSGRVALFALVVPNAAVNPIFRDPSHAGANSSRWSDGGNQANSIVAVGVDTISVGTALNTNLVSYSVFIILGDTAGMINGTYTNLYCALPDGGPFTIPDEFVPGPNIIGDGGIVLNGSSPLTLLKDASGIYTLVPGRRSDVLMDRQTGQTSLDVPIPNPRYKTGYLGG